LSEHAQGFVASAGSLRDMSDKLRRLVTRWRVPEREAEPGDSRRDAA
jgi:hypothetical protein